MTDPRDVELAREWLRRPDPNGVSLMICPHVDWAPRSPGDCEDCLASLLAQRAEEVRQQERERAVMIVREMTLPREPNETVGMAYARHRSEQWRDEFRRRLKEQDQGGQGQEP